MLLETLTQTQNKLRLYLEYHNKGVFIKVYPDEIISEVFELLIKVNSLKDRIEFKSLIDDMRFDFLGNENSSKLNKKWGKL